MTTHRGNRNPNWKHGRYSGELKCSCGKKIHPRNKSGLCRSCWRKSKPFSGEENPFHGRHHAKETRDTMKAAATKRDRSTYKHGVQNPESISIHRKKYWSNIPKDDRQKMLVNFIGAGQRFNKKASRTKCENTVAEMLVEINAKFDRSVKILGYFVDFLVGSIIVEVYGDYWHCNPRVYAPDYYHKNLHITASEKWDRDALRLKALSDNGYEVLVFWEMDVETSPADIIEKLKEKCKS